MGCSDGWNDFRAEPATLVAKPMTPREREFEGRIKELEQVVGKVVKIIYDDDSLTTSRLDQPTDDRVAQLEKANAFLREQVEAKDAEIKRLHDLAVRLDNNVQEAYDDLERLYQKLRGQK